MARTTAYTLACRALSQPGERLYCSRCGERLNPARAVWLELNMMDGTYDPDGRVPEAESQGGVPFGAACAKAAIAANNPQEG